MSRRGCGVAGCGWLMAVALLLTTAAAVKSAGKGMDTTSAHSEALRFGLQEIVVDNCCMLLYVFVT